MLIVCTALEQLLWYIPVQDRTNFKLVRCVTSAIEQQKTYLMFMNTKEELSRHCLFASHDATDVISVREFWAIYCLAQGSQNHTYTNQI